jgi:hypothetical protein
MLASPRIPVWIAILFAIDLALALAPVADFLLGSPYARLRNWLDLDSENSLQAWFSSMQWLCAAFLFGLIPLYSWKRREPTLWTLSALALLCLVFSVDEILGIHEWLGDQSDVLLPGGSRANTALDRTGIWPFLIGIPVVAVLTVLVIVMRRMFARTAPGACGRLVAGVAIMFTGALLVELGKNVIDARAGAGGLSLLQLVIEEGLEMVGVTFIVWAAHEFALARGFALIPPAPLAAASQSEVAAGARAAATIDNPIFPDRKMPV